MSSGLFRIIIYFLKSSSKKYFSLKRVDNNDYLYRKTLYRPFTFCKFANPGGGAYQGLGIRGLNNIQIEAQF